MEHVSTHGGHPRHFALTPDGAYLIAANRDGNNLVVFSVDRASGRLSFTGNTAEVSKPVCVKPAYFPVTV
ncbi:6-phosphogluconolactonase [compost metagenome]